MPFLPQLILYLVAFVAVWLGAGFVVGAVSKIAHRLKLPAFTLSFFLLGLLTSLPELVIGLTAISEARPEIFVGNLIGGTIIIFLLVIPLLGMANKGVKSPPQLNRRLLLMTLLVCFTPTILTGDRRIDNWEGLLCLLLYFLLFFFFSRQQNLFEKLMTRLRKRRSKHNWTDPIKVLLGVALLAWGSHQIVDSTLFFADVLKIAPFFVSLVVVSLGTNLPELALVGRSLIQKKSESVALADYLGSASANTLLLGMFSLLYPTAIIIPNHFVHRFLYMFLGLVAFYFFLRSGHRLSRREGLILLLIYVLFVITELRLQ